MVRTGDGELARCGKATTVSGGIALPNLSVYIQPECAGTTVRYLVERRNTAATLSVSFFFFSFFSYRRASVKSVVTRCDFRAKDTPKSVFREFTALPQTL